MNQLQLYINDQLADLADDSPIALTFQINNLAEVRNQQGNTSNQFRLPLTQRNRQILGFPDDVAFATGLPYDNYQARLIQDGLEIIPYGIAVLNSVEQDGASITILSGNVDFFDAIDYNIYDTDSRLPADEPKLFAPYQHVWNIDNIVASQNHTEGWIWPLVDYGNMTYSATEPNNINIRTMRLGFFLKTAINLMAKQAGYKINPDSFLLKDPMYDKLIVQFANDTFEHGTDYQKDSDLFGVQATLGQRLRVSHPTVAHDKGNLLFANITSNNSNLYNPGTGVFTSNAITKITITLKIPTFYLYGKFTGDYASNVNINLIYNDPVDGDYILTSQNFDLKEDLKFEGTPGPFNGYHIVITPPQQ